MYQGSKFLVKMAHVHVDRSIEGPDVAPKNSAK